jgi:hypothetical protein
LGYYLPYRQYVCTLFSIVRTWNEWPTPEYLTHLATPLYET